MAAPTTVPAAPQVSRAEFAAMRTPFAGGKLEYIEGRVTYMSPVGPTHGRRALGLGSLLRAVVRRHKLGDVRVETGYWIGPNTMVGPDISFINKAKFDNENVVDGYSDQIPDLAIEVTSPNDRDRDVQEKVEIYLAAGTPRVWVVRPELRTVAVHLPDRTVRTLKVGESLGAEDAGLGDVPMSLALADIFD
jgi:Uma2 family endonuclease